MKAEGVYKAGDASVSAFSATINSAAEFTQRSRHGTAQAAMDPGIPLVAAFMLTDFGLP